MEIQPRIALIDDDAFWLDTMSEFLAGRGFDIQTASSGLSGLALLKERTIPLAMVDFHMPDMDGLQLLRSLREEHHPAAVLLVSGDGDPSLPTRAREEGALGFFSKTTPPRVLLRALDQAWEQISEGTNTQDN
ncbi:MAG: response regulator [Gemmataceae bacterium]